MERRVSTTEEMRELARETAAGLKGGDVLGLVGDLGAGKTTFTQYLAEALGVEIEVKSPTFVLLREYPTGPEAAARNVRLLVHADAYRLETEDELWALGFEDYAGEPDTVCVVEWADRVPSLRDVSTYREMRFRQGEGEDRVVEMA